MERSFINTSTINMFIEPYYLDTWLSELDSDLNILGECGESLPLAEQIESYTAERANRSHWSKNDQRSTKRKRKSKRK